MDISYITLHVLKETCQTYIIVFSRYCVSMFGMWYYYYRITFFFSQMLNHWCLVSLSTCWYV